MHNQGKNYEGVKEDINYKPSRACSDNWAKKKKRSLESFVEELISKIFFLFFHGSIFVWIIGISCNCWQSWFCNQSLSFMASFLVKLKKLKKLLHLYKDRIFFLLFLDNFWFYIWYLFMCFWKYIMLAWCIVLSNITIVIFIERILFSFSHFRRLMKI